MRRGHRALVEQDRAIIVIARRLRTEGAVVDSRTRVVVHSKGRSLETVLQTRDDVAHSNRLVGDNPHGQRLHIAHGQLALDIGQVAVHARGQMAVDGPDAGVTQTPTAESGRIVGVTEAEFSVLALEVASLAGKTDAVGRNLHVGRVGQVHPADAALVGMCHHSIVRNTHGNPHDALAARPAARHLEHPRLIGVAHRERLARAAEAVLLGKARHHSDGLARRTGALQAQVHERAVVDDTRVINQFLTSLERRFADSQLRLVHAWIGRVQELVSVLHLRNLTDEDVVVALHLSGQLLFRPLTLI